MAGVKRTRTQARAARSFGGALYFARNNSKT